MLVSYILVLLGCELQLEKAVLLMLLHNSIIHDLFIFVDLIDVVLFE